MFFSVVIPSPTVRVQDVPFHENVHYYLNKHEFEQARKIQMYVWPAIMRNMNVCYVNGPKSGKTMAYLPAIYSFLLEESKYFGFNVMLTGPLAVIVCEGNRKAEEVYDMVLKMKGTTRSCDVVLALLPISPTVLVSVVLYYFEKLKLGRPCIAKYQKQIKENTTQ